MKAPEKIYLTEGDTWTGEAEDFDVLWCEEKITDEDVEYIRADVVSIMVRKAEEQPVKF